MHTLGGLLNMAIMVPLVECGHIWSGHKWSSGQDPDHGGSTESIDT